MNIPGGNASSPGLDIDLAAEVIEVPDKFRKYFRALMLETFLSTPEEYITWIADRVSREGGIVSANEVRGAVAAFTPVTYGSGWADYGSSNEAVGYWRSPMTGIVYLRGLATKSGGTPGSGDTIFTLPEGYRPPAYLVFTVATGATSAFGRVDIEPDGDVKWIAGNTTETDFVSFSGLWFATT